MTDIANAKAICNVCPVYATCLRTALGVEGENREEYGIWAGTSGRTRKRIWSMVEDGILSAEDIVQDILNHGLENYEHDVSTEPQILPFSLNRNTAA
jgi:hypothetical protein